MKHGDARVAKRATIIHIILWVMKYLSRNHDAMLILIAVVLVGVGLARNFQLSLILTTMTLGIGVINRDPKHGSHIRFTIENTGAVVYVLFFALAGARLPVVRLHFWVDKSNVLNPFNYPTYQMSIIWLLSRKLTYPRPYPRIPDIPTRKPLA